MSPGACVYVCACVMSFLTSGFLSDLMHCVLKSSRAFLLSPLHARGESDGKVQFCGREGSKIIKATFHEENSGTGGELDGLRAFSQREWCG